MIFSLSIGFIINHEFRWKKKSKSRRKHFNKVYADWLQQSFSLKTPQKKKELKPLELCSERTKKRRLEMQNLKTQDVEPGPSSAAMSKDETEISEPASIKKRKKSSSSSD